MKFPNKVGLAAGFDKDAKWLDALALLGFGFVEIGTVTPRAQSGNPKPRLFRLVEDEGVLNRMGFNNEGLVPAVARLVRRPEGLVVGGNIGKNKITPNDRAVEDYLACVDAMHAHVDYFVVNVSSPNTPGLRELQDKEPLTALLRAVATDGHRLARVQITQPVGATDMPAIIIPRKTVGEVHKLLEEAEGEVSVQVSDTKINFAFDNIVLTSKLIDGKFPDYTRVIPVDNDKVLGVDAKTFAQSVDRVSAISSEKSRAVKLSLDTDSLGLSVSNPDSGNASDEISVSYQAEPLEIGFNARYLMDITSQLDGELATFELSNSGAPTIVRDGEDTHALYVLMPMRV